MSWIIVFVLGLMILVAVTLFFYQFFENEEERRVRETLAQQMHTERPKSFFFKIFYPFMYQLSPLVSMLELPNYRERVKRMILTAGMDRALTTDEFIAFKIVSAFFFAILPVVAFQRFIPTVEILLFLFGFFFPDLWLKGLVDQRQREILKNLPYFIDLLTLSVEAGLDFQIALQRVIEKAEHSALRTEFSNMLQEIKMGRTRGDALRNLAHRVNIQDITSFAAVLIQADQLGSSVGSVMRAQSDKMRAERFQRAEKMGAQAATKILIPIMIFVLPALFVVMFGSFMLSFLGIGGQLMGVNWSPR
jgi:tight adherence protein C